MTDLVKFSKIRQQLEKATQIDEIKEIRDKAEVLRLYSKNIGESLEIQNQCAEIKIRAERKAGKLIPEQFPHGGDRKTESRLDNITLKDVNITKFQSYCWQLINWIPEKAFEGHIEEIKGKGEELTSNGDD